VLVRVDPTYYRPAEVDLLVGCADKAKKELGWRPAISVEKLCAKMVEADIRRHSAVTTHHRVNRDSVVIQEPRVPTSAQTAA